jgi:hypothetical protein
MLELKNNTLQFSFPEVHSEATVGIDFQRTFRIPDDDKQYPLPPGLGLFPTMKVDDLPAERVPATWKEHGGVMIPMYQSEALWISFNKTSLYNRASSYPFAIRIATGKVSALTGKIFVKKLSEGDYLVVPDQPWLDGFVVGDGFIRQFVASPLGSGVSVEAQITGEDKIGGIQIEVIPMKKDFFEKNFPVIERKLVTRSLSFAQSLSKEGGAKGMSVNCCSAPEMYSPCLMNADMSLAAGGKMKQQVFKDRHGLEAWDTEHTSKFFVHLVNSMAWQMITGKEPPTVPLTAKEYTARGFPWFEYYEEKPALKPTSEMEAIKPIKDMPGGKHMLPENESVEPKNIKEIPPKKEKNPHEVREGKF